MPKGNTSMPPTKAFIQLFFIAFVAWVMRTMLSWYCAHYLSVNTQKIHKETVSMQTTFSIHLTRLEQPPAYGD